VDRLEGIPQLTPEKIQEMLSAHFQEMEEVLSRGREVVSYVWWFFISPLYIRFSKTPLLGNIEKLMKKQCDEEWFKEFEGTRANISSRFGPNVASSELNEKEINGAITDLLERLSEKLEPEGSIDPQDSIGSQDSIGPQDSSVSETFASKICGALASTICGMSCFPGTSEASEAGLLLADGEYTDGESWDGASVGSGGGYLSSSDGTMSS